MTYIKPIEEMLLLQQKLNDETNGKNWETGITKDKKLISWKRCIYMECAELVDSFAWKHW
ncbi:dUTP diphosphatase, partial [Campylobacter fetus]